MTAPAFVFFPDPDERAWIVSTLTPVVGSVVALHDPSVALDMLKSQSRGCLVASTEPDPGTVLELVRALRSRGSQLPAIILGPHTAFRTAVEIARLDATVFLERPLTALQLRGAVQKACAS